MACGSPMFPLQELPLFSDYGFDPHIDYFQELFRGARRKPRNRDARPLDALRFKLQKPICKDKCKNKKTKWWKRALLFWKWRRANKDHIHRDNFSKPILGMVSGM